MRLDFESLSSPEPNSKICKDIVMPLETNLSDEFVKMTSGSEMNVPVLAEQINNDQQPIVAVNSNGYAVANGDEDNKMKVSLAVEVETQPQIDQIEAEQILPTFSNNEKMQAIKRSRKRGKKKEGKMTETKESAHSDKDSKIICQKIFSDNTKNKDESAEHIAENFAEGAQISHESGDLSKNDTNKIECDSKSIQAIPNAQNNAKAEECSAVMVDGKTTNKNKTIGKSLKHETKITKKSYKQKSHNKRNGYGIYCRTRFFKNNTE